MEQLTLNLRHNEDYLKGLLERSTGRIISLAITDNSTSLLSVRTKGETVSVRLHRIFLDAGNDVIDEIAEFIKKRRGKTPLIRSFVKEKRDDLKKKAPRRSALNTTGRHRDLRGIYESINVEYFQGTVSASITWGNKSPKYAVRKRTLGSYSGHTNTIRINPVLDSARVPLYFLEFVVYHEMLHAYMGVERINGMRSVHSREFRERERMFRDYEKAIAWEKRNRF